MKLIKLECPNCHATLETDIEHLQAYCQYCGTKLLFDLDQLNQIISEKEKTKRYQIQQETYIQKTKINTIKELFQSTGGEMLLYFIGIGIVILAFAIADSLGCFK